MAITSVHTNITLFGRLFRTQDVSILQVAQSTVAAAAAAAAAAATTTET